MKSETFSSVRKLFPKLYFNKNQRAAALRVHTATQEMWRKNTQRFSKWQEHWNEHCLGVKASPRTSVQNIIVTVMLQWCRLHDAAIVSHGWRKIH